MIAEAEQQARQYFKLHKPIKDHDKSRWQILEEIYRDTGKKVGEFADPPAVPPAVTHVWSWFFDLSRCRQNGMGINPIAWHDLTAYQAARKCRMQQWEIDLLLAFDGIYLDVMQNEQPEVIKRF